MKKGYIYLFAAAVLVGLAIFSIDACIGSIETPPDHFASVRDAIPEPGNYSTPTTYEEGVLEKGLRSAGREAAWFFLFGGIFLLPSLAILIVPGVIFGRLEKIIEGIVMFAGGLVFMLLADTANMEHLSFWALAGNIVPGGLLFIWGIVTPKEEGKLILVALPMLGMGLYAVVQSFAMVFMGFLTDPLWAFLSMLPGCGCIWTRLNYFRGVD